jgi:hypothetical protein
MASVLRAEGYDGSDAIDGFDALKKAAARHFDATCWM